MGDYDAPVLGGRYRLGTCLGGGGMADVYRAVDTRLDRLVAVKLFRSGTDENGRQRFEDEARLLAGLSHPGLVPVHDASASGDELYLVMQLVEGATLSDQLAAGPLSPMQVAALGHQLAAVLDYVHSNGIVHRDVKPSNVLLSSEGRVFLADFGVSRLADAVGRMTASGVVMGTATYMAPEQVRGDDIAYPVDIYALGLVLLECVTGRVEYEGAGAEAAVARLTRAPQIPDGLAEPLTGVLREMLSEDPQQRPSAARCADLLSGEATEIIPAVSEASGTEPPTVPGTQLLPPETERAVAAQPERRRTRGRWPLVAALAGLVLLVVGFFLFPSGTEPDTSPTLPPASGPAGVERLPADLANLERMVRG